MSVIFTESTESYLNLVFAEHKVLTGVFQLQNMPTLEDLTEQVTFWQVNCIKYL